ncbi:MAG: hypothetical protein IJT02_08005 [Synergistaceae bacterium]|nr:hypothetical protein [Synergistaceae bacterium]
MYNRKKFFVSALSLMMMLCAFVPAAFGAQEVDMPPHLKPDGSKYQFAYIDYDEYMPASTQFFHILAGLQERGWIKEGGLPFTINDIETKRMSTREMYSALQEADLGEYIAFAKGAFHYLGYEEASQVEQDLRARAGKGIDFVITFGTSAGVFVKNLGLPIPMVDFSATDPVASGIIASSTEGSGNPNVWAQVEPSFALRQIKYYYSLKPFKKLGVIIYGDEIISGLPDIKKTSQQNSFDLVVYHIDEQPRETAAEQQQYYQLVEDKFRQMSGEGIDAFYLTVDLINDPERLYPIISLLYEKGIPVYLMDDPVNVRYGVLMLVSAYDFENVGRFVADAIVKILGGAEAGSLPCVYASAPSIYFNYEVARRIGYPLHFEFLAVCDEIFTKVGAQ